MGEAQSASCLLLHTESIDEQAARAAAVALLQAARLSSQLGSAAACAHLAWVSEDSEEQASKRARIDKEKASERKVRCRQVLLRYAGCTKPMDPVRKKAVSRSMAEAEVMMLGVLDTLEDASVRGGAAAVEEAFTKQVR